MAVNFIGTPKFSYGGDKSCPVLLPDGAQSGERVYILFSKRVATIDLPVTPAGWDQAQIVTRNYEVTQILYERVIDGTEGASVSIWTPKNGDWNAIAFRTDSLGGGVVVSAQSTGANSNLTCPGVSTTQDHSSVLRLLSIWDYNSLLVDSNAVSKPAGLLLGESFPNSIYNAVVYTDHETAQTVSDANFSVDPSYALTGLMTTIEFIGTENAMLHSITDIDADEITEDGQQNVSFEFASASADPTSLVYKSGDFSTPNLLISASNGAGQYSLPDISEFVEDTPGVPFTSGSHTIQAELTDDINTAQFSVDHVPKAGWSITEFSAFTAGGDALFPSGYSVPDMSQVLAPDTVSFNADGTIETDLQNFKALFFNTDTGIWNVVFVNIDIEGAEAVHISHLELVGGSPADSEKFKLNRKLNRWENGNQSVILPVQ